MDKFEQYLVEYISNNNGINKSKILLDVDIFENSYIDSLGIFTLLVEIENKFGKEISLEDISTFKSYTIVNIAQLIKRA